jgi:hypothetical protein
MVRAIHSDPLERVRTGADEPMRTRFRQHR